MSRFERFLEFLAGKGEDEPAEGSASENTESAATSPTQGAALMQGGGRLTAGLVAQQGAPILLEGRVGPARESPEAAQTRAEMERLRTEVETLKRQRIETEAVAFADAQIYAGRAFPAEREAIIAALTQAALLDGAPGAQAAGGAEGQSMAGVVKALYAQRPPHGLTQEQMPTAPAPPASATVGAEAGPHLRVLPNPQETQIPDKEKRPVSAERKDELLAQTSLGQAALAKRKAGRV